MGAYGGLCVFDHARWLSVCVPALRAGESHPLIQSNLAATGLRSAFAGLATVISYGDPELTRCELGRDFVVCDGVLWESPARAGECSARWDHEALCGLIERILTRETLSGFANLGLTVTAVRQLLPEDVIADPLARDCIARLDDGCRYWAHGSGGYGEGIRGWLDADGANRLAEALKAFDGPGAATARLIASCRESGADASEHMRRIQHFRAVLAVAESSRCGVLWGRDLRLFYDDATLFAVNEPRPRPI